MNQGGSTAAISHQKLVLVTGSADSPGRGARMYHTRLVQIAAYGISFGATTAFYERSACRWCLKRREVLSRVSDSNARLAVASSST